HREALQHSQIARVKVVLLLVQNLHHADDGSLWRLERHSDHVADVGLAPMVQGLTVAPMRVVLGQADAALAQLNDLAGHVVELADLRLTEPSRSRPSEELEDEHRLFRFMQQDRAVIGSYDLKGSKQSLFDQIVQ